MPQNILRTLKQLYLTTKQHGKIQMQRTDLTAPQANLLCYLFTHQGQGNYGIQLHTALGISRSFIFSALKILRQKGYFSMKGDPLDDGKKQIILTPKAYDAEQKICSGLIAQEKLLCSQISKQRLRQLADDLERMLRNLRTETEGRL